MIKEPLGALTGWLSTLAVFVDSDPFRGLLLTVLGPQKQSNSPRNGPESAKTASVDDRHVNAPQGSLIMGIILGPQNSE